MHLSVSDTGASYSVVFCFQNYFWKYQPIISGEETPPCLLPVAFSLIVTRELPSQKLLAKAHSQSWEHGALAMRLLMPEGSAEPPDKL